MSIGFKVKRQPIREQAELLIQCVELPGEIRCVVSKLTPTTIVLQPALPGVQKIWSAASPSQAEIAAGALALRLRSGMHIRLMHADGSPTGRPWAKVVRSSGEHPVQIHCRFAPNARAIDQRAWFRIPIPSESGIRGKITLPHGEFQVRLRNLSRGGALLELAHTESSTVKPIRPLAMHIKSGTALHIQLNQRGSVVNDIPCRARRVSGTRLAVQFDAQATSDAKDRELRRFVHDVERQFLRARWALSHNLSMPAGQA